MLLPLLKGEVGRGLLLWDVDQDGCPAGAGLLAFRAQIQEKPMSKVLDELLALLALELATSAAANYVKKSKLDHCAVIENNFEALLNAFVRYESSLW
jgi:hypothetical protein